MCEYCEEGKLIERKGELETKISIDIDSCDIMINAVDVEFNEYVEWFEINFCPMCGNSLREEVDDTSENDIQGYCPLCGGEYAIRCSECGYCETNESEEN